MSSQTKICFNPDCKAAKSERWRRGWWLRTGDFAELCERCGSAFEEGRFCDTFHSDAAGWRNCESCGKRLHCGCIVSIHALVLLDAGGVDCIACARKNISMASNQIRPSSLFLPLPERLKDLSVKNRNLIAGPTAVAGQWRHPFSLRNTASAHSESRPRMPYEVDSESKNLADPSERVMFSSPNPAALDRLANGNAGVDTVTAFQTFHREEGNLDVLQSASHLIGDNDPLDTRKGVIADPGLNTSVSGMTYEVHPNSSTSKDDSSTPHFVSGTQSHLQTPPPPLAKQFYASLHNGVDVSVETQIRNGRPRGDVRGRNQLLSRYWPKITDQELRQISGNSNSVITPLFEKMLSASDAGRIGRLVLPKKCAEAYFPTISQPEGLPLKVQDAKGNEWVFQFRFWPNNNSRMYVLEGVTPCIQSMQLQAGDTVTFSRIDPEGKLVMGFRKASSVPPTDQDKQPLKAGKAGSRNADVNNKKSKPSENISTPNRPLRGSAESTSFSSIDQVNSADPAAIWSKVDKSGYIAKDVTGTDSFLLPSKRKSSILRSKSKRLQIEKEDLTELKLTWDEAQGLLRPPLNSVPSVVIIEGHEFEEYEEAPILGKPTISASNNVGENIQWAQCEDCSKWRKLPVDALLPSRWTCSNNLWDPKRSSCSSAQEVTTEQLEDLLLSSNAGGASKKTKAVKKESDADEASAGLDTLANLAILGEGEALPPSAQPTTRHPRHRAGCTCIVCIQPPSGKGPKHKDTCTCNVCMTVKRRFRTLMLRREKRQSEKEAESARKKLQLLQLPDDPEQEDFPPMNSNTCDPELNQKMVVSERSDGDPNKRKPSFSPFKGQIDLNIQPEREDEPSPVSDSGMIRLTPEATDTYLKQQGLVSLAGNRDQLTNQIVPGGDGGAAGGEKLDSGVPHGNGGHMDGDMDNPIVLSTSVPASTSATG